jgi:site-specific recombinase XerD
MSWKQKRGQSLEPDAPLFVSRKKGRLSRRQLREMFHTWQIRAGIERPYNVHQLRHAACTSLYRQTKDIRLTARFARHKSLVSTQRYTHATLEELVAAVQGLPC